MGIRARPCRWLSFWGGFLGGGACIIGLQSLQKTTSEGGPSFRKNKEEEVPWIGLNYPLIAKRTGRWGGGVGAKDYAALAEQCAPSSAHRNSPYAPTNKGEGAACARAVRQCLNFSVKSCLGWLSHLVLDL